MKVLMHMCCAPCTIYPLKILLYENIEVMGFFYRHNIHPYTECLKRENTLKEYCDSIGTRVIYQKTYELESFLQSIVFREKDRCIFCYHDRLSAAAKIAKKGKFNAFTSTLLYSKFQNHELIRNHRRGHRKKTGCKIPLQGFQGRLERRNPGIKAIKSLQAAVLRVYLQRKTKVLLRILKMGKAARFDAIPDVPRMDRAATRGYPYKNSPKIII